MPNVDPPRFPRWLLERLLPKDVRGASIRGDLLEELSIRARRTSRRRARYWYWTQSLAIAGRSLLPRRQYHQPDLSFRKASVMDSLRLDLTFAVRSLLKARGFTATAVVTLALGVGASTAVFSVANAVLLRPLPFAQPDRLMWMTEVGKTGALMSIAWPDFLDWRERTTAFEELAAIQRGIVNLTGSGEPERLVSRYVTSNFFDVLGVRPARGRVFTASEDRVGSPRAVLISDALWRRRFNADPAVLGRSVLLGDLPHEVIGVLPAGLRYNLVTDDDVIGSLGQQATPGSGLLDRGNHNGLSAIGRLRPGMDEEAARRDLGRVAAALTQAYPNTNADVHAHIEPLEHRLVGTVAPMISVLFGAVAFLLVLAMVNVANLLVARGVSRRHELSVRAALGCSRWRLVRQLLVESTVLVAAGGAVGVMISVGLIELFLATAPEDMPRLQDVGMSAPVWVFAFVVSTVSALLIGVLPALQGSAIRGQQSVVRAGRGDTSSASANRVRRALMVVEVALAIVLLTGAGLMTRTMYALASVDPGFDPANVLTLRFSLTGDQSTPDLQAALDRRIVAFGDDVLERARAVPGVEHAALALSLPIEGSQWGSIFLVGDQPIPPRADLPIAAFVPVSAGFFETMRIKVQAGRPIDRSDTVASQKTAVVNETFARRFWPNDTAIGKRLKQGWPEDATPWREIVGVVSDIKLDGVEARTPMQVYLPYPQEPTPYAALVVRTSTPAAAFGKPLSDVIHDINPNLPVFAVQTMHEMMRASVTQRRMTMVVFGGFAIVALVMACVGLYGVISHGVSERMREVGVRIALGATTRQVISLFVGQGVVMTAIGAIIGIVSALALAGVAQELLFQVAPTDPLTFSLAAATLMLVSMVACYIPARRASRVSPTIALRGE